MQACRCTRRPCPHAAAAVQNVPIFPTLEDEGPEPDRQTPDDFAYTDDTERRWAAIRTTLQDRLQLAEAWTSDSPRSELLRQAYARLNGIPTDPLVASKTTWADSGPLELTWRATATPLTISAIRTGAGSTIRTSADLGTVADHHKTALQRTIHEGKAPVPAAALTIDGDRLRLLHSTPLEDAEDTRAQQLAALAARHAAHAHTIAHLLRSRGILLPTAPDRNTRPGVDRALLHLLGDAPATAPAPAAHDLTSEQTITAAATALDMRTDPPSSENIRTLHDPDHHVTLTYGTTTTPGLTNEPALTITVRHAHRGPQADPDVTALWEAGHDVTGITIAGTSPHTQRTTIAIWPVAALLQDTEEGPEARGLRIADAVRRATAT